MPRLTSSSRQSRRDEIADAAMACINRVGFAKTTMADIIAESGLSAGSIYSHFASKNELVQYASAAVLEVRQSEFEQGVAAQPAIATPRDVLVRVLARDTGDPRYEVILQIWAESMTDSELATVARANVERLRSMISRAILPWAQERVGSETEPGAGAETAGGQLAERTAAALMVIAQGYAVQTAMHLSPDAAEMLELLADGLE